MAESGKHEYLNKHPSSSWRERYKKHADDFDKRISEFQKLNGIDPRGSPRQELWKRISDDQSKDSKENFSPQRNSGSKASRRFVKQPRPQLTTESKGKAVARPSKPTSRGQEDDSATESESEREVQHSAPHRLGKRPARDDDDDDDGRGAARKRRRVRKAIPQEEEEEGEEEPAPAHPARPAKSLVVHEDGQSDVEMSPPIIYAGEIFDEGDEGNSGSSSDDPAEVDRLLSEQPIPPEEPPLSPSQ